MTPSRQAPIAGAGPFVSPENVTLRAIAESLRQVVKNQNLMLEYLAALPESIEGLTEAVVDLPHTRTPRPRRRPRKERPA